MAIEREVELSTRLGHQRDAKFVLGCQKQLIALLESIPQELEKASENL
jgi:hypothetical protein